MTRSKRPILAMGLAIVLLGVGLVGSARLGDPGLTPVAFAQGVASNLESGADSGETASLVTFHIPTITCSVDPMRVEGSVRNAPGVLNIAFDGQNATVTYDPTQLTSAEIAAAIEAGGDIVEPVAA
jgi:copper chaperone CopZ